MALTSALHWLDATVCSCGCGQHKDECWAEEYADDWIVDDTTVCYAGAALAKWRKEKGEDVEPGTLVFVRRESAERSIAQQEDPAVRRARQAQVRAAAKAALGRDKTTST